MWTGEDEGPMATRKGTKKLEPAEKAPKPGFFDSLLSAFRRPSQEKAAPASPSGKDGRKRAGNSGGTRKLSPGGGKRGVGNQKRTTALPQAEIESEQSASLGAHESTLEQDLLGAIEGDLFSFGDPEAEASGFFSDPGQDDSYPPPPRPQPPVTQVPVAEPPRPAAPAPRSAPQPPAGSGSGLFAPEGVDRDLDSLFDSFEPGGTAPAVPAAAPAPRPVAPPPATPSSPSLAPAAPAPAAPAAAAARGPVSAPVTALAPSAGASQDGLVSIGKLLVDQNTLKRIIDNAEKRGAGVYSTTTIISNSRGADLDQLLQRIDGCEGVQGSLIVGRDGLVIASTLPATFEKELVGAIASSMLTNLDVQGKKMRVGSTRLALLDTEGALVMLVALQVGVLVVMAPSLVGLDLTAILSVLAGDGT